MLVIDCETEKHSIEKIVADESENFVKCQRTRYDYTTNTSKTAAHLWSSIAQRWCKKNYVRF